MANKKYNEFTAGTPAGSDIILFADPVTGALEKVTIDNLTAGVGLIMRTKITKTFADFAAAALTNTISSGFTLPAGGLIHNIFINPTPEFSGGSIIAYNVSVGITGSVGKWVNANNVFTGASNNLTALNGQGFLHSMSASVDVKLTATSSGANLNAATAGQVDIWIYYSVLS